MLLNERRISESVQYEKHLLRLLSLPDSITSTLSYLTANHPLLSLFTLSLPSLFPPPQFPLSLYLTHCPSSPALQSNSSVTFNQRAIQNVSPPPLPSPIIFHFSSRFLLLHVIHPDSAISPHKPQPLTQSMSNSEAPWAVDTSHEDAVRDAD